MECFGLGIVKKVSLRLLNFDSICPSFRNIAKIEIPYFFVICTGCSSFQSHSDRCIYALQWELFWH